MKWAKKRYFGLIFILVFTMILAACSSGTTGSSNSTTNDTKKTNSTDQGSEKQASDKKVTITYAYGKDNTGATDKIIEAFMKKYPNIEVKSKVMPTSTNQQHDAYVTMLNGKSAEIDVFDGDVIWPAEFSQAGYALPLDRFIQADGFDIEQYNKGAVNAATFNGKLWALPEYVDAGMLYYRTDIVDSPPKTWDDLIKMSKEYQGKQGTEFGYLMQAKQYEGLVCNAVEFIASYGGTVINDKGEVAINSPESIKGLKKLVEIGQSNIVPQNVQNFTEPETDTAYRDGQAIFSRNWPYQYSMVNNPDQSKVVDKVAVAPLPAGDAGSASTLGGWMGFINQYTENPQAAWTFLKFMAGPEGQKINAIYGGKAPAITKLFDDPEVQAKNPYFKEEGFVNALNNAVSRPVAPNYAEISEILQINISKAIAGDISVEDAVKTMDTDMKSALKK